MRETLRFRSAGWLTNVRYARRLPLLCFGGLVKGWKQQKHPIAPTPST